jgi:cyclopropane fatty-acyl-phospholipid synthase-like methyltransferase
MSAEQPTASTPSEPPSQDTNPADPNRPVTFQRYYADAGPDYATWSPNFNMHFGYFRRGLNPFHLEPMLEQMNREILTRLHVLPDEPSDILDMGCGVGATLRSLAHQLPAASLTGITLVPWQIERGTELNNESPSAARIQLVLGDYEHAPFPSASFDAAYALESSCYAHAANKSAFLAEAHRLLRPGGRLAVADGFLLHPPPRRGPQHAIYRRLCDCWVIETLGEIQPFILELERLGFHNIQVEHLQYRVAPSVFHVPWVTLKFLVTNVLFGSRKMTRARWNNILAPILLPFVSHPIGPMTYCLVTATRA